MSLCANVLFLKIKNWNFSSGLEKNLKAKNFLYNLSKLIFFKFLTAKNYFLLRAGFRDLMYPFEDFLAPFFSGPKIIRRRRLWRPFPDWKFSAPVPKNGLNAPKADPVNQQRPKMTVYSDKKAWQCHTGFMALSCFFTWIWSPYLLCI